MAPRQPKTLTIKNVACAHCGRMQDVDFKRVTKVKGTPSIMAFEAVASRKVEGGLGFEGTPPEGE